MNTTATLAPTDVDTTGPELGVTQQRVIRSEWIKLCSVRSTRVTLILTAVVVAVLGILVTALTDGARQDGVVDPASVSLAGTNIAQLVLGVLGAVLVTSEYSTGLIRTTLAAVPARLPVLWAKGVVYAGATAVTMITAVLVAFTGGQALFDGTGASFADSGVLRAVLGAAVYPVAIGTMGVALGFILRSTASAVAVLFGVLFLAPGLVNLLGSWATGISAFLPSQAGQAISSVISDPDLLSPLAGFVVLIAWLVGLLAAAAWVLRHRDA